MSLRGRERWREPPFQRTEPNHGKPSRSARAVGHESRSTKNGQCSRADAGSIGPSALPSLEAMTGSVSAQQATASCRSQRAWAVPAAIESRPTHGEPAFWRRRHRRGTGSRPQLIWRLRTELWTPQFSRSRALRRMLASSARALWPFLCVSGSAGSPIARAAAPAAREGGSRPPADDLRAER